MRKDLESDATGDRVRVCYTKREELVGKRRHLIWSLWAKLHHSIADVDTGIVLYEAFWFRGAQAARLQVTASRRNELYESSLPRLQSEKVRDHEDAVTSRLRSPDLSSMRP